MQANWSLILNVVLLLGVLVTIGLLMKTRKQNLNQGQSQPERASSTQTPYETLYNDDIIAVRKVESDYEPSKPQLPKSKPLSPQLRLKEELSSTIEPSTPQASSLMLFLLAKEHKQFAGYELLQTVLAAGLRFGEDQLFHRHQLSNGQGPILCSLAAATASGVFDLQNIGAFSARGLCLFMNTSKNVGIDKERFSIMLETARQLSKGLDAHLLDGQQKPLTTAGIEHYLEHLQSEECLA